MNSKAQVSLVGFMLAVVVILLALAWMKPVNQITTSAMNTTSEVGGMDCDNTTDDFVKAGCWVLDINQGYFIGSLIALAGALIAAKVIFG